jgi:glycosyltransferase involved in cell wall biosynthesis
MRIAFIAGNRSPGRFLEDPSLLYRCENLAAGLRARGHQTMLTHVTRVPPWAPIDVAVFHRPRMNFRLRALLTVLRRRGVRLVADVDDLIFDEQLAQYSPGVMNRLVSLDAMRTQFAAHRQALSTFDTITVSTTPLAEEAEHRFPHAQIVRLPNAVHHSWRELTTHMTEPLGRVPVVTYLPGTHSHDRDFATITPALVRLLATHARLNLHITGRLEFDLAARPCQLKHQPRVRYAELYPIVRAGWLNVAPLEATPFTRCKSALKVIEAGFWGIPTVCSPLPDAERFVDAGAICAETPEQWYQQVERLLLDPDHYATKTARLRERVLARADVYAVAKKFLSAMSGVAAPR